MPLYETPQRYEVRIGRKITQVICKEVMARDSDEAEEIVKRGFQLEEWEKAECQAGEPRFTGFKK
jgi:hypothetical protein